MMFISNKWQKSSKVAVKHHDAVKHRELIIQNNQIIHMHKQ